MLRMHPTILFESRTHSSNVYVSAMALTFAFVCLGIDGWAAEKSKGRAGDRRLTGLVIVDGTDHENFVANETVHHQQSVEAILNKDQPAAVLEIKHIRWGGECRVEVSLTAKLLDKGKVQIEGTAKLFEGDSEETDDLEEEKKVTFAVTTGGKPISHLVNLRNSGFGGGDHAEIKIVLTNSLIEEDE